MLSLLNFDVIDSVVSVLQPLHELTNFLIAEKRISGLAVKSLVQHICNNTLLVYNDDDTDMVKDMKERIKVDLMQ